MSLLGRRGIISSGKLGGLDTLSTFQFNAITKYVSRADDAALEFGSGDFCISYYFNWGASVLNSYFACKDTTSNRTWFIQMNTGLLRFAYTNNGTTHIVRDASSISWSTNTWFHVIIQRVSTTIEFYVDQVAKGTGAVSGTLFDGTGPLEIGRLNTNSGSLTFPGSAANFFMFTESKDSTERDDLYNLGVPLHYADLATGTKANPSVAYEMSSGDDTVNDLSGNGLTGTKNGGISADGEDLDFTP